MHLISARLGFDIPYDDYFHICELSDYILNAQYVIQNTVTLHTSNIPKNRRFFFHERLRRKKLLKAF